MSEIWRDSKGIGRLSYSFRMIAYLSGLVIVLAHHQEYGISPGLPEYITIALVFIVPHAVLYEFVRKGKSTKVIFNALALDFLFSGWVAGLLDFCIVPSTAFALGALSNHIASNGFGKLNRVLLVPVGFAAIYLVDDVSFRFESTTLINNLTAAYVVLHAILNSYVLFNSIQRVRTQNLEIRKQRAEIQEQSEELKVLNESLLDMNANLEEKVLERTQQIELKNRKLAEYSFANAHELRAPVARILGLIQLLGHAKPDESGMILDKLNHAASELDDATHSITARLEADEQQPVQTSEESTSPR